MRQSITQFRSTTDIAQGARVITMVTAIRWFGWGFAETLIPVLLYSYSDSFAQAGILGSTYDIGLILALPVIGILADRMRATGLILIGLMLYLFVGTSYLLAGVTGLALFIVIARVVNGISYALDSVGRETYFRRLTPVGKVATTFGYFDTIANLSWIASALIGIILIKYFSITTLLFLISPTSLIALVVLWKFHKKNRSEILTKTIIKPRKILKEISEWNWTLKGLIVFNFFIECAASVIAFFLPIEVYREDGNLTLVIIMGIVATIPALLGWCLGKWFDRKGSKMFGYTLLALGMLLFSVAFFHTYIWQLIVTLMVGVIIELLSVGNNELVTAYARPEHFGKIGGTMRSISTIGAVVGPLAAGIIMDAYGIGSAYIVLGLIISLLAVVFYANRWAFKSN